jgi:hypothetical protein
LRIQREEMRLSEAELERAKLRLVAGTRRLALERRMLERTANDESRAARLDGLHDPVSSELKIENFISARNHRGLELDCVIALGLVWTRRGDSSHRERRHRGRCAAIGSTSRRLRARSRRRSESAKRGAGAERAHRSEAQQYALLPIELHVRLIWGARSTRAARLAHSFR